MKENREEDREEDREEEKDRDRDADIIRRTGRIKRTKRIRRTEMIWRTGARSGALLVLSSLTGESNKRNNLKQIKITTKEND